MTERYLDSAPYPWPYNGNLTPENTALIVIDMQTDFCGEGGYVDSMGYDLSLTRAPIEPISRVLEVLREQGFWIIHTREGHRPDLSDLPPAKRDRGAPTLRIGDPGPMGRVLIAGEPGADIIPELRPIAGETVIDKPGKGAFHATSFGDVLKDKGLKQLVFAGVTTEVCVQTTMREANDRGYECILAIDATESYFPAFKQAAIDMIRAQGAIVGWTASTDQIREAIGV